MFLHDLNVQMKLIDRASDGLHGDLVQVWFPRDLREFGHHLQLSRTGSTKLVEITDGNPCADSIYCFVRAGAQFFEVLENALKRRNILDE